MHLFNLLLENKRLRDISTDVITWDCWDYQIRLMASALVSGDYPSLPNS